MFSVSFFFHPHAIYTEIQAIQYVVFFQYVHSYTILKNESQLSLISSCLNQAINMQLNSYDLELFFICILNGPASRFIVAISFAFGKAPMLLRATSNYVGCFASAVLRCLFFINSFSAHFTALSAH